MKKRILAGAISIVIVGLLVTGISGASYDCSQADFNGDGIVNLADFSIFAVCFGQRVNCSQNDTCCQCDLNGDGIINLADFSIFAVCYGYRTCVNCSKA